MCFVDLLPWIGLCYTLSSPPPYSTALSLDTWTVAIFLFFFYFFFAVRLVRSAGVETDRQIDRTGDSISMSGTAAGAGSAPGGLEGSGYLRLGFCLCLFVCLWVWRGGVGTGLQVNNTGKIYRYTCLPACLRFWCLCFRCLVRYLSSISTSPGPRKGVLFAWRCIVT
jgi:hypothetical protein